VGSGRRNRRNWLRHLAAIAIAVVFVLPLYFMLSGSLRKTGLAPPRYPELIPSPLAWGNFERAFELVDIPRYMLNSMIVVAFAVPLTVLTASWAAFVMFRLPRRWAGALIVASLVALMVPLTALLVPRFVLFKHLGLIGTPEIFPYVPLIAPAILGTSPFYVLLYYWSFKRLPPELFEAARLEGLGPLAIWRRVAMPLVRPVTVAVAVLAFVFTWGNFLDPLIFLSDQERFTVPLGLRALSVLDPTNFPLLLAGSVAATLPVVLVFLYVQRYFLQEFRDAGWLGR
jgi:multiple sugar transport system permease protein